MHFQKFTFFMKQGVTKAQPMCDNSNIFNLILHMPDVVKRTGKPPLATSPVRLGVNEEFSRGHRSGFLQPFQFTIHFVGSRRQPSQGFDLRPLSSPTCIWNTMILMLLLQRVINCLTFFYIFVLHPCFHKLVNNIIIT